MKKNRELQLIQKKFLVENVLRMVKGLERTPKSFSEHFDTGKKAQDAYGNDRINERWVYLLSTNRVPSSKTINQIIEKVPELNWFYYHVFWDVINPFELTKFQILKLLCKLPHKIRKHLGGLKVEKLRKKDFVFSFPSTKRLFYIGSELDLDAFSALFLIMRYEKLKYPDNDLSINYLYEELAFSSSIIYMHFSLFKVVKNDIYNFIYENFKPNLGYLNARTKALWKLDIPIENSNQWYIQLLKGKNKVRFSLSHRETTFIQIYSYILQETRKEESVFLRLLPKASFNF